MGRKAKDYLSKGCSKYGADMGRKAEGLAPCHPYDAEWRDIVDRPDNVNVRAGFGGKLRLMRMPLVDGAYDQGGAYWGSPDNMWLCVGEYTEHNTCVRVASLPVRAELVNLAGEPIRLYIRAATREEAKAKVRAYFPSCRFYK